MCGWSLPFSFLAFWCHVWHLFLFCLCRRLHCVMVICKPFQLDIRISAAPHSILWALLMRILIRLSRWLSKARMIMDWSWEGPYLIESKWVLVFEKQTQNFCGFFLDIHHEPITVNRLEIQTKDPKYESRHAGPVMTAPFTLLSKNTRHSSKLSKIQALNQVRPPIVQCSTIRLASRLLFFWG